MSHGYELLYIISSANKEQDVNNIVQTIKDQLKAKGAQILHHQGFPSLNIKEKNFKQGANQQNQDAKKQAGFYLKQKFAYPIKGENFGYYLLCYFKINTEELAELKELFLLNKQILRFNILKHNHIEKEIQKYLKSTVIQKQNRQTHSRPGQRPVFQSAQQIKKATVKDQFKPVQPAIKSKKIKIQEELKQGKVDLEKIDEELDNILKGEDLDIDR